VKVVGLALSVYSFNDPGELQEWHYYDESSIDIITAALWNGAGHFIFALWFLSSSSFFFSSPNLSGRKLDVYHTSTHGVALVRI